LAKGGGAPFENAHGLYPQRGGQLHVVGGPAGARHVEVQGAARLARDSHVLLILPLLGDVELHFERRVDIARAAVRAREVARAQRLKLPARVLTPFGELAEALPVGAV
jgi:hypothetical protein